MMKLIANVVVLLCMSLLAAMPAAAKESLQVAAPSDLQRILPELMAAFEQETGTAVVTAFYPDDPAQRKEACSAAKGGVFIAGPHPMQHVQEDGLVAAETVQPLFYKRLSLGVQHKNPHLIFAPADLGRPGVRVGVMKPKRGCLSKATEKLINEAGLTEAVEKNTVFRADRFDDLAAALAADKVDAVVCWDTLENLAPDKMVVVRLAGQETKGLMAGAVKASSADPAAQKLIEFLAAGETAKKVYGKYGYSLTKESDVKVRDSQFFRNFHTHHFYYIYQLLVQQIFDDYGVTKGTCLDIGCGGSQMLINMARLTELDCVGLDIEPEILAVAAQNVAEAGFSERFRFVTGDVHNIPLPDDYADLIMSRGSIPFWRDRVTAFEEIYRVLKPGGVAFIGGGGSRYLTEAYYKQIKAPWVTPERREKFNIPRFDNLEEIMAQTTIPTDHYRIIKEGGNWVEMRK